MIEYDSSYLTAEQVSLYLKAKGLYPKDACLTVEDLHTIKESIDGYVNLIYHICDTNGKSMVLKQIVNLPRSQNEELQTCENKEALADWTLDIGRLRSEIAVLIFWNTLVQDICPQIYLFDEENGIIVMEDLTDHSLLRYEHCRMTKHPEFPEKIGTFMARNLFFSSDLHLTRYKKKTLETFFENPEYTALDFFLFEDCTMVSGKRDMPPETWRLRKTILEDPEIQNTVKQMRHQFLTSKECLIHTDLHASNIMINHLSLKIIDTEFAGFGPIAQDWGRLLASFCLNFFSWYGDTKRTQAEKADFGTYLLNAMNQMYTTFEVAFRSLCDNHKAHSYQLKQLDIDNYLLVHFQDTLLYIALNAASRLGDRGLCYDLERLPSKDRIYPQNLTLLMVQTLFKNRGRYNNIVDFTNYLRDLAGSNPSQSLI